MAEKLCVKCGAAIVNLRADYQHYRWCAPCCEDCYPAVETETGANIPMWPYDWHGGWAWSLDGGWLYWQSKKFQARYEELNSE